MANQKLTELPSASLPLGNSDLFYIVQQGTTTTPESFSITFHNLATSIVSGGGGSVLFQVNGVDVTDQTTINFVQSSNMTVTNPSAGTISFASGGGGGSGGALSLVQKQTLTSDVQDVTFSGLDGNTDEVYLLMGRIKNTSGSTSIVTWRPNNATTNQRSNVYATFGSGVTNNQTTTLQITAGIITAGYFNFALTIFAKADPNAQSFWRTYTGNGGGDWSSLGIATVFGGAWEDTSTNITSLVIHSNIATGIGNGSTFALYKYAQS